MHAALRLVGGPARIGVGDGARARREQPPRRATGRRKRDDGFAKLGAEGLFPLGLDAADHGFEDDGDGCAGEFEFAPLLAIAGRGEAEVGAEAEISFLRLDGKLAGVADGEGGGLGKGCFENFLPVDQQPRRAARAQEQPMFPRGQANLRRRAEEGGKRPISPHAGRYIFLR